MTLIFFMSHQAATTSSGMSRIFVEQIQPYAPDFTEDILTTLVRKSAHIFMFFVLGILLYVLVRTYNVSQKKRIALSVGIAFGYAVFDEIHQMFVPGRSGEVRDVLIDTIGASLGVLLCYIILKQRGNGKQDSA